MKQILWILGGAAWLTGVVTSIAHEHVLMILLDFFVPPIGVIHGLVVWFS